MTEIERISAFEREYGWQKVLLILRREFDRHLSDVRRNVKTDGKSVEASYHAGCADTLEWVSRLPEIIKKELAKQTENDHARTSKIAQSAV